MRCASDVCSKSGTTRSAAAVVGWGLRVVTGGLAATPAIGVGVDEGRFERERERDVQLLGEKREVAGNVDEGLER
jgi:hypothetical protein